MQPKSSPPLDPTAIAGNIASRAEKRLAFATAYKTGRPLTEIARALGIPLRTAASWARKLKDDDALEKTLAAQLMTRAEIGQALQAIVRGPDPDLTIKASVAYARLMGLEAPQRAEVTVRSVPPSIASWLESRLITAASGDRQSIDSDDGDGPISGLLSTSCDREPLPS